MSKVAILGAGPTGLMAAWAVLRNGHEPVIYSRDIQPPSVNEDMFLYRSLPGVPDGAPFRLEIFQFGNRDGYARKVYGGTDVETSWEQLGPNPSVIAWWLKPTYEMLWEYFRGDLIPLDANYHAAKLLTHEHPLVISTLPAPAICGNPRHLFVDIQTWLARYKDPDWDQWRSPNQMIYNGDEESQWFRFTSLNGWRTWEYAVVPPASEVSDDTPIFPGKKFLSNTCDCLPNVFRVGRYAQWRRGVLNHHAFEQATSILASYGLGKGA